jgi:hypothetical protein
MGSLAPVAITRQGFKPLAQSESRLKTTEYEFQSIEMDLGY